MLSWFRWSGSMLTPCWSAQRSSSSVRLNMGTAASASGTRHRQPVLLVLVMPTHSRFLRFPPRTAHQAQGPWPPRARRCRERAVTRPATADGILEQRTGELGRHVRERVAFDGQLRSQPAQHGNRVAQPPIRPIVHGRCGSLKAAEVSDPALFSLCARVWGFSDTSRGEKKAPPSRLATARVSRPFRRSKKPGSARRENIRCEGDRGGSHARNWVITSDHTDGTAGRRPRGSRGR